MYYDGKRVDWSHRAAYIKRKHDMTVKEANEALTDPGRVVYDPDPTSESGKSVRIVGWSTTFGGVVTVILVPERDAVYGVNAWRTDGRQLREYLEVNDDE